MKLWNCLFSSARPGTARLPRPCGPRVEELENRIVPHASLDFGLDGLAHGGLAMSTSQSHGQATSSLTIGEGEQPGTTGKNDTLATAQYVPNFGTGPGKNSSIDVNGTLGVATVITSREDDGAIPLANSTGLTAGSAGQILVSSTIGNGPNGSSGTGKGDYDFFKVPAAANQLITVRVNITGSTLNSVAAIYNSSGTLLAINDDAYDNDVYGFSRNSYIRFLVPANDTHYVAVFGSGSAPQANPFVSSSGGGAASEGTYTLNLTLESPSIVPAIEDNGSIPLASPSGITAGAQGGKAFVSAFVGDGPHGSAGTGTGDFDFYSVPALAGQVITADLDAPDPGGSAGGFDSIMAVYNSAGQMLSFNDDDAQTFNSLVTFVAPTTGTYYVAVGGFRNGVDYLLSNFLPGNPFDSASGPGAGVEGAYSLTIQVKNQEYDYYSFDVAAGDVLGANVIGDVHQLQLFQPDGTLLAPSTSDPSGFYPASSPLPGGGGASLAYVISTPGRYAINTSLGTGQYTLQLRDFRPGLEQQPVGSHQILYLDYSGPTVDASALLNGSFPPGQDKLSPLSSFLPNWGLTAADENAVIDAINAEVTKNLAQDVSGVLGRGLNGDYTITGRAGDFQIEILNSRDNPGAYGQPNVSRVIVGGTLDELQAPDAGFVGLSPSIDVGNFNTTETAFVVLDAFSDTSNPYQDANHPFGDFLGAIPRAPGVGMAAVLGEFVGNVISHEAGHMFGNWHTDPAQNNIMNGGGLRDGIEEAVGPDRVFGTADDVDARFGRSNYSPSEYYPGGIEDTLDTIAFGLSTGKQAGTYFDFVTGTLYVTGSINDGHPDVLQVKTAGANLQVYINGQLSLTRASAGVNRVVLNGSDDDDLLDASLYAGAATLQGRGGNDLLKAGLGANLLFGGDGNDLLLGGTGNDVLVGGDGLDALFAGAGRDVLIGGRGSDLLCGGGGDNLLIAGYTAFDADAAALSAISAEWSSNRSYEDRVANLRGVGSGSRANQNYFLKAAGSQATIFDDLAGDILIGGSGRDWYFALLTGKKRDEIFGLGGNEFVDEM
jgi:RTX calcium-binding nonapeptide repeat (4 copies)/Bacterial pre-peptidase C-terminal domain